MAKPKEDTPLLKQYFSVKAQNPDAVLLFRVGDFYESYSDDALITSKVLGIVLTRKSNGEKGDTPMAGIPHHALAQYLPKLVRAGYKVAICDQLEDPKLAQAKLVKRGVTEILTPGIAFGEGMLEQKEHNWLCGLAFDNAEVGAAFLDASTGTFRVAQGSSDYIATLLASFSPKELVVQRDCLKAARERYGDYYITPLEEWAFVYDSAAEKLRSQLRVDSLKGFGVENFPLALCSAGALIYYLEQTHHSGLQNICSISRIDEGKFVWMDRFTIRNLEIFASNAGKEGTSLVDVIDRCSSPMGARLLRSWLSMPIMDRNALNARYDVVQFFYDNDGPLDEIRLLLGDVGDLERILARAATGKILPREMMQLRRSLRQMEPIKALCSDTGVEALDKLIRGMKNCGADRQGPRHRPRSGQDPGRIPRTVHRRQGLSAADAGPRGGAHGDFFPEDRIQQRFRLLPGGAQHLQGPGASRVGAQADFGRGRTLHNRGTQGVRAEDTERGGQYLRTRKPHLRRPGGRSAEEHTRHQGKLRRRLPTRRALRIRRAGHRAQILPSGGRLRQRPRHKGRPPSRHRNPDGPGRGICTERRASRLVRHADNDPDRPEHGR